jgi:HTH-type transcriptional regulator / antitoxin HigA
LKHPKRPVFLDDASAGSQAQSKEEQEANQFAADTLIPPAARQGLGRIDLTAVGIRAVAARLDIHPGIVVGCLLNMGLVRYSSPLCKLRDSYALLEK